MALTLTSPWRFRERILAYGGGGAGKTTAALNIARHTPGHMHVIDNDESYAWARALETDFPDIEDKVTVHECDPEWEAFTSLLQTVIKGVTSPDDWLVVDSISSVWEFVQIAMTERITGSDAASFMAQARKDAENLSDFHKQMTDIVPWSIIKKEYAPKVNYPMRRFMGHVMLTAEAQKLGKRDLEQADLREDYGHIGFKPRGEGRLGHITSSRLFLTYNGKQYKMTTAGKDRNRRKIEHVEVDNFAIDYLMNVAGWQRQSKNKGKDTANDEAD